jgi:hypothetical protein
MYTYNPNSWNNWIFCYPDKLKNLHTNEEISILPKDVIGEWRNEYKGTNVSSGIYYVPGTGIYYVYYDGNNVHYNGQSKDYSIIYGKN